MTLSEAILALDRNSARSYFLPWTAFIEIQWCEVLELPLLICGWATLILPAADNTCSFLCHVFQYELTPVLILLQRPLLHWQLPLSCLKTPTLLTPQSCFKLLARSLILRISIEARTVTHSDQLCARFTAHTLDIMTSFCGVHRGYAASENTGYLSYIESNGHILGADDDTYTFSWDDKRVGTKILLSKNFLDANIQDFQVYKAHSDNYICSLVPGSSGFQAQYTVGGLFYKGTESNLQYVTSTAFLLLTYAKYLRTHGGSIQCGSSTVTENTLISLAKKQVDYILGQNPQKMSYMVGFGNKYPQHVHHRGSSVPSVHAHPNPIACGDGFQYFYSSSPNPNVLVGAIVGGPDNRDGFADDRNNYQQSEPATYINAPFVGALAFFKDAVTVKSN